MLTALKVSALAGLMAAGVLLAGAIGAGAQETTTAASPSSETPAWVWLLLGILAAGLIVLIVLLARRGGGGGGGIVPLEDRSRRLDTAVAGWTVQAWALETQAADSAVLVRGGDRLVTVDQGRRVSTLPLPNRKET